MGESWVSFVSRQPCMQHGWFLHSPKMGDTVDSLKLLPITGCITSDMSRLNSTDINIYFISAGFVFARIHWTGIALNRGTYHNIYAVKIGPPAMWEIKGAWPTGTVVIWRDCEFVACHHLGYLCGPFHKHISLCGC